ncbi:MAG: hypothetical protein JWO12_3494 [Frankiales bacterium]|jgi:uncharacterized protein (TIGR03083 family)|nr:hypothetical protein [Frankiales bacterium]
MDDLSLLEHEVEQMSTALGGADPAREVEGCPGWTIAELTAHLTAVHRWATAALETTTPPPYDEAPADAAAYTEAAQAMLARLRQLPADHPCWTFDKQNPTAGFWRRRQKLEVAVHRWDVAPYAISDEVAIDGIDEVLGFFLPRQVHLGRTTLPDGTLTLVSPSRTWTVGQGGDQSVLEGSPADLLLAVYQRGNRLPGAWGETPLTP